MTGFCKSCETGILSLENYELVCTQCGQVQQDGANDEDDPRFESRPDYDTVKDAFRNKTFESIQRISAAKLHHDSNTNEDKRKIARRKLLEEMRHLVKQLIKNASAVDETMDLINSVLKVFKGRMIASRKLGLVGACIYYISAKHMLGITLHDICKAINVKMRVISLSLKQVKHHCPNFEYERTNIKDLVRKFIDELANKHYDFDSLESNDPVESDCKDDAARPPKDPQTLIDKKDRIVLQNRVMLLIDLFEAMHPYNQPTPQNIIAAVVYHAWKSLDTFKMIALNLSSAIGGPTSEIKMNRNQALRVKHSISYEKFCQICNLKYSSNGYKVVSKLQSSLLMLGRHIGDVNKINLPWFLKDIIENSPHLIQVHLRNTTTQDAPPTNEKSEDC